ncbi:MAG: hypothetical protein SOV43_01445 [Selenomonadaceae bacterium]|nr:hypothetical protein [Selenomonadaceae bacterium]MDY2684820.1 hypothetical protein [Selenomonadaceae bacterium]
MLKRILLIMCAAVMMAMPVCSAENWVKVVRSASEITYIDMDSAWYDGHQGGYMLKTVFNEKWGKDSNGTAVIEDDRFMDCSDGGELIWSGTTTNYNAEGYPESSTHINEKQTLYKGTNGWRWCQIVKRHCGYTAFE